MINRLCIVGVGLIGGSLALALRRRGACREIVGSGRDAAHLQRAVELGVIDRFDTRIARAAEGADTIVIAVPVGSFATVLREVVAAAAPDAIVTDVGSTKGSVVSAAREVLGERLPAFVPAHPIAGGENSGVTAADAGLFDNARVVLTPLEETDSEATGRIRWMWEQTGATIIEMTAGEHDRVLAATSHLPHVLAYALVDMLAAMKDGPDPFDFAAGGFRDFTRIASSDPQMWHDVCLANRDALLAVIDDYRERLNALQQAITQRDSARITAVFERAKKARDRLYR